MKKAIILANALLLSYANMASASPTNAPLLMTPPSNQTQSSVKTAHQPPAQVRTEADKLAYTAQNKQETVAKRTEALAALQRFPNKNSFIAVARAIKEPNSEIRMAALIGSRGFNFDYRFRVVEPLFNDPEPEIRIAVTSELMPNYMSMIPKQKAIMDKEYNNLITSLFGKGNSATKLKLADIYRWHNDPKSAEPIYQELQIKDAKNPDVWINSSENYRVLQDNQQSLKMINEGIKHVPDNAKLHYAKSLILVREKNKADGLKEIKKAAELAKTNSYYWYLYAIMEQDIDIKNSTPLFEKAYLLSGSPEHLYAVCENYLTTGNRKSAQCMVALEKVAPKSAVENLKKKFNLQ
ncbi:hypothetical protein L0B53_00780 [Vibrio sp. SS-MA-C1-2]|uniref:tetratricopeptide repeat protein n=1 Tax=Vibrio sp. SS-MA-C1-2 TaxID=2908646 RepID=UPI001F1DF40A|nr:hypothetical protein [Vibrio sp. SS-MA-C1-2]UJF17345.1 hypothetical protein L0B53_00780 [Vibrio sp. SS-MA-C1-2]